MITWGPSHCEDVSRANMLQVFHGLQELPCSLLLRRSVEVGETNTTGPMDIHFRELHFHLVAFMVREDPNLLTDRPRDTRHRFKGERLPLERVAVLRPLDIVVTNNV